MAVALFVLWLFIALAVLAWGKWGMIQRAPQIMPLSKGVDLIIALIEKNDGWVKGEHRWSHQSGISIWVANKDYGLCLSLDGEVWPDPSYRQNAGTLFPLKGHDKKAIWQAIKAGRDADEEAHTNDTLLTFARNIETMYGHTAEIVEFPSKGTAA